MPSGTTLRSMCKISGKEKSWLFLGTKRKRMWLKKSEQGGDVNGKLEGKVGTNGPCTECGLYWMVNKKPFKVGMDILRFTMSKYHYGYLLEKGLCREVTEGSQTVTRQFCILSVKCGGDGQVGNWGQDTHWRQDRLGCRESDKDRPSRKT